MNAARDAFRDRLLRGSLVDAFAAQAAATPAAPAVVSGPDTVTYAELVQAAFGIGHQLADRLGLDPEPVVLMMSQGVRAIAGTLALLSAGKTYVPFDPRTPVGLLRDVVAGIRPRLILADPAGAVVAAEAGSCNVLVIDELDAVAAGQPAAAAIDPDKPAYVYFTSGSTGAPKGVVDSHRNVLHNAFRYTTTLGFNGSDRMSLVQPPSISAVVGTQFAALSNGAALCPIDFETQRPEKITASLAENAITVFHSTPTLFQFLTKHGLGEAGSLRLVRLEGDRATSADVDLLRRFFAPDVTIVNGLGATECGVVRQFFVRPGEEVAAGPLPVGFAVPDVEVAVVDATGAPAAAGRDGEVVVRSDYLATGYWNDAALTAARFRRTAEGGRVYHTGDIGQLAADGRLELVGRTDDQVKVLGITVNLAAVEAIILAQPGVSGAMVTAESGDNPMRLLAAVTVEPGTSLDERAIRRAVLERLPAAAVPIIRAVDALPATAAGKVDRRRER